MSSLELNDFNKLRCTVGHGGQVKRFEVALFSMIGFLRLGIFIKTSRPAKALALVVKPWIRHFSMLFR